MPEIRETHVERDEQGRVVDTKVTIDREPARRRRSGGGGFGWGLLLGVLLIVGAIIAFAYSQGSFRQAGLEADRAAAQIEETTESAAGQSLEGARLAEEQTANETSETATN